MPTIRRRKTSEDICAKYQPEAAKQARSGLHGHVVEGKLVVHRHGGGNHDHGHYLSRGDEALNNSWTLPIRNRNPNGRQNERDDKSHISEKSLKDKNYKISPALG